MDLTQRKRNRLKNFDYSQNRTYFITICVKDKKQLLGRIINRENEQTTEMVFSSYGLAVDSRVNEISDTYKHIIIEKYCIMPNHIHLLVSVCADTSDGILETPSQTKARYYTNAIIPSFLSTFKRFTNKDTGFSLWQRSYHDHIIRNEFDYKKIWQYIEDNPRKWREDCFYSK